MSYDSNFSNPIGGPSGAGASSDAKINQQVMMAANQMKLLMEISEKCLNMNNMCWQICDVTPKDKLDGRAETCLTNCAERYMDTANYVQNRLMQKAQDSTGGSGFS